MLGFDVRRVAEAAGHETVALTRAALDVADEDAVARVVTEARPDAVVNCAAWTDVDGAEGDEAGAAAVNGAGAGNVAAAAAAAGAWMIHVSTDYVFDGTKTTPYVESDRTGPVSAYGRTKLEGEIEVAAAIDHHTIVRTAWLFGAGGPCFPQTILRLAGERDEIAVVSDQVGCPTFTGHLAGALVSLAEDPQPGVLHVAAAETCSWFDFAVEIVATAGADCRVNPCTTDAFPRPARRPAYSVLESERGGPSLPAWREGLAEFMSISQEVHQ